MKNKIRVRFAPAPTGMMHLGNIRTALMNFLLAQQKQGTFVLRIEDTDATRNYDPDATKIIQDLHWLGLNYDEGPQEGGPYEPYFQSKRSTLYQKYLQEFIDNNLAYRCFCTQETLDKKRERQKALKLPPRYDRTCMQLSPQEIQKKLDANEPFIWRFKLDHDLSITIKDLAHGNVTFDMSNFSDFPITRQDGSVTFMFANFVDDVVMKISYVIRGEDHLSNTAGQAALYHASNNPLPTFWHMPILTNIDGKKLSKRDFGFSLRDLKDAGYLPEAICNYLAIIGSSYPEEIMDMQTLAKSINFDKPGTTGQIKYDVEKLNWVNKKWIAQYNPKKLTQLCRLFLTQEYPNVQHITNEELTNILQIIKTDLITLHDVIPALKFIFVAPDLKKTVIEACIKNENIPKIVTLIKNNLIHINNSKTFADTLKKQCKEQGLPLKEMFWFLRLAMMGATKGPTIHELVDMLGSKTAQERIERALDLFN